MSLPKGGVVTGIVLDENGEPARHPGARNAAVIRRGKTFESPARTPPMTADNTASTVFS
jgi:hypothetical protein